MQYTRPSLVTTISQELLCTHRNTMDVAYALSEIYNGIYSSRSQVHSLERKRYTGVVIPGTLPNTLYLVYTQAEKESLTSQGYGSGPGSRILTVNEAQGLTYGTVVIMRTTTEKHKIYDSVQHAVVAVSRHTVSCVYYTDDCDDATGRLIESAMAATTNRIKEYNLKMALRSRDAAVVEALTTAD
ncbi:unnamed protein product [Parnassius mnemosyne]|uniref:(+)RNA virus helicase C-terminal domain-containing protein n=1 Tax=Parnassius mnemosyne TaxID=213953 RepID=A0AAV1LYT1_9NEOP